MTTSTVKKSGNNKITLTLTAEAALALRSYQPRLRSQKINGLLKDALALERMQPGWAIRKLTDGTWVVDAPTDHPNIVLRGTTHGDLHVAITSTAQQVAIFRTKHGIFDQ